MAWENADYQIAAAVLGGGLAGAVLNQGAAVASSWYRRPVLEITFDERELGCVAQTPLVDANGALAGRQRYLRLCVRNQGRSSAKNVNVCLTQINLDPRSGAPRIFATEVLDLKYAMTREVKFDIGSGAHRYVDIFGVSLTASGISAELGVNAMPIALLEEFAPERQWIQGRYSLVIFATAENAQSLRTRLDWSFDGSVEGTQILGRVFTR